MSTNKQAIELRMWARHRAKAYETESQIPSSTPQMCLEREIAELLRRVEQKAEELLSLNKP